ncbi:hypothetical protein ACFL2Q_19995, partial [Thermodesulfobacteriota bacterium]
MCDNRLRTLKTVGPVSGQMFKEGELFYTKAVDSEEASKLGAYLVQDEFFDGNPKSVFVDKRGVTYRFRSVVKKGIHKDEKYVALFELMAGRLSANVFNGSPVRVLLSDGSLQTLRTIGPLSGELSNGGELFYTPAISSREATKLAKQLVADGFFDGTPKTVKIDKSDKGFQFYLVVEKEKQSDAEFAALAELMGAQLSKDVFEGKPVEMHLCDSTLTSRKKVGPAGGALFGKGELYYTPSVSEDLVKRLGKYLLDVKFFDDTPKSVQIRKVGPKFQFRMVVIKEKAEDLNYISVIRVLPGQLSRAVFDGAPTELHVCDDYLVTQKVLGPMRGLGFKAGELVFSERVSEEEAKKLGDYLLKLKFFDDTAKIIELNKAGQTYQVRMPVKEGYDKNKEYLKLAKSMASDISKIVFGGAPVEVHLCNEWFRRLRIVTSD